MEIVIERPADQFEPVTECVTVDAPTQFVYSGDEDATIKSNDAVLAKLTAKNPTFDVFVAGEYCITISKACSVGPDIVTMGAILSPPMEVTDTCPDTDNTVYCNSTTNTQWMRVTSYACGDDGVPVETIVSDTDLGVPCSGPTPDIEDTLECRNGTQHIVWYQFITDSEGATTVTEIAAVDQGTACIVPQVTKVPVCFTVPGDDTVHSGWEIEGTDPDTGDTMWVKVVDSGRTIDTSDYTVVECPNVQVLMDDFCIV